MNEKMKAEIKELEDAGISVVATHNGKLSYVTGGGNQNENYCDSCSFLAFKPDPDPYDWFRDNDQKAVCERVAAKVMGGLERPSEMVDIPKPIWCPKLGRELTDLEKEILPMRLASAKEDY